MSFGFSLANWAELKSALLNPEPTEHVLVDLDVNVASSGRNASDRRCPVGSVRGPRQGSAAMLARSPLGHVFDYCPIGASLAGGNAGARSCRSAGAASSGMAGGSASLTMAPRGGRGIPIAYRAFRRTQSCLGAIRGCRFLDTLTLAQCADLPLSPTDISPAGSSPATYARPGCCRSRALVPAG
jgi:hypothetical protein